MEVPCPHCNHVVSVPETQRSWLPFLLLGLLGAFVLLIFGGFILIAGLTFPALTRAQSALAAERMAAEAAREQELAARMQAEEALQKARAGRDESRSDDLKALMQKQREQLEKSMQQQQEMRKAIDGIFNDANDPAQTRERLLEAREKLREMEKKAREDR